MEQYKMCELTFQGIVKKDNWALTELAAELKCGDVCQYVRGFYAGDGIYKVRFLPRISGIWNYKVSGCLFAEGTVDVQPAKHGHGPVRADKCSFRYDDGEYFYPFGTTVYALIHQENSLIEETMETLRTGPFNKVRFCVFPKHYDYNQNEPPLFPFEKKEDGSWDVTSPCIQFWDRLDEIILQMDKMKIQADLILFHPYDRWGFSSLSRQENMIYLDYLLRRLSAMPNVWWSISNEYDLVESKTLRQWEEIECFIAERDSYKHLLSNHNCFAFWDFSRPNITHVSVQTKMLTRIAEWRNKYKKPVVVDECCYEGNIPAFWGSISGREMVKRFWRVVVTGGYCTHGETYLSDEDILWWSKGGRLKGESPDRIAFLRSIVDELPGPIEPINYPSTEYFSGDEEMKKKIIAGEQQDFLKFISAMGRLGEELQPFLMADDDFRGHCGEDAYLVFYDLHTCARSTLELPDRYQYRIELIDTWEMTREVLMQGASGKTEILLPGKEGMAVMAVRE